MYVYSPAIREDAPMKCPKEDVEEQLLSGKLLAN